ncbi:MAG: hypothetical protein K9W44_09855 [Candidatus Lokiarchaeota archaeon]|nr:hypothetical protein [Candidatus Harpocratesius repetitus]
MIIILPKKSNLFVTLLICMLMMQHSSALIEIPSSQSPSALDFDNLSLTYHNRKLYLSVLNGTIYPSGL